MSKFFTWSNVFWIVYLNKVHVISCITNKYNAEVRDKYSVWVCFSGINLETIGYVVVFLFVRFQRNCLSCIRIGQERWEPVRISIQSCNLRLWLSITFSIKQFRNNVSDYIWNIELELCLNFWSWEWRSVLEHFDVNIKLKNTFKIITFSEENLCHSNVSIFVCLNQHVLVIVPFCERSSRSSIEEVSHRVCHTSGVITRNIVRNSVLTTIVVYLVR